MADLASHLDTLATGLAQPEVPVNNLVNALSSASLFGKRSSTSAGLTWGYYGGVLLVSGVPTTIANGTVALTASATNYIEATTAGVVSKNTVGFTAGRIQLYIVTTNSSGPTNEVDKRYSPLGLDLTVASTLPVSDATAVVKGSADTSKLLRFEVDGFTTATTRVVTPQNRDGTMALEENLPEAIQVACSDETTNLTTGVAKVTFRMPFAMILTAVRASLTTPSSSGTPTIDINERLSGSPDSVVTILSTKITIDVGERTSVTAAIPPVISDPNLADDAEMSVDIDVAGTGAKGLKVTLIGRRA